MNGDGEVNIQSTGTVSGLLKDLLIQGLSVVLPTVLL